MFYWPSQVIRSAQIQGAGKQTPSLDGNSGKVTLQAFTQGGVKGPIHSVITLPKAISNRAGVLTQEAHSLLFSSFLTFVPSLGFLTSHIFPVI